MMNRIKTEQEIAAIRTSGKLLSQVLDAVMPQVEPGMTTFDVAEITRSELKGTGGKPAFLGFHGFPHVICISLNDEVIHGIPSRQRIIEEGDLVSLDFGVNYDGMITDSARTLIVGKPKDPHHEVLVNETEKALLAGINAANGGSHIEDIAAAIEPVLTRNRFGIVRDFVGHGVGHEVHEDPNVPNFKTGFKGPKLKPGMTLAIEPMATLGADFVYIADDGWTVITTDHAMSAHWEHTILITDGPAEILTVS